MNRTTETLLSAAVAQQSGDNFQIGSSAIVEMTTEVNYFQLNKGILQVEVTGHVFTNPGTHLFHVVFTGADAQHFLNLAVSDATGIK